MTESLPLPLARLVTELDGLFTERPDIDPKDPPPAFLSRAADALRRLVARDDWLPPAYARANPERYQQYLLYGDPVSRYSVVSFVWGPGQKTPIHDHQVWGLVGILRGAESSQPFAVRPGDRPLARGPAAMLTPGIVETLSPATGDMHLVAHAAGDDVAVSIHIYGGDIGRVERWTYPPDQPSEARRKFVSGYDNGVDTPPFAAARL